MPPGDRRGAHSAPGVECASVTDRALASSLSSTHLSQTDGPFDSTPLQFSRRVSSKAARTLGITELPSSDRREAIEYDDDDDQRMEAGNSSRRSTARVSTTATTTNTAGTPHLRRTPGGCESGTSCFKLVFILSVAALASCAVFVSAFVAHRVEKLEARVLLLEAAKRL